MNSELMAVNYAAQAQRGLSEWADRVGALGKDYTVDSAMVRMFADTIEKAQHFVLPENGVILDDNLRGIVGEDVRLPYPLITVAYFVTDDQEQRTVDAPTYVPKRLLVARELSKDDVALWEVAGIPHASDLFKGVVSENMIHVCVANEVDGRWAPCTASWFLPSKWQEFKSRRIPGFEPLIKPKPGSEAFSGRPAIIAPGLFSRVEKMVGYERAMREALHDISGEVRALLEFLEALSCSNVGIDTLQKPDIKVNARRKKKGKLPILEVKVLTIKAPNVVIQKKEHHGGTHASPRQHLRRGHIRRLQTGQKIWVQSCVVGAKTAQFVQKDYKVIRA